MRQAVVFLKKLQDSYGLGLIPWAHVLKHQFWEHLGGRENGNVFTALVKEFIVVSVKTS